jgi:electron transfer flavoprotein alpha subunit
MNRVLVIAEHDGARLNPATARAISAACDIRPGSVDVAVLAADPASVAAEAARLNGVSRVLLISNAANTPMLAAVWAPQVAAVASDYTHLLAASTTFGKDLLPRVAALCGVGQLSDIMAVESAYRFRRPIYAGNAIATVAADPGRLLIGTVRSASFPLAVAGGTASIEPRDVAAEIPTHTRFIRRSTEQRAGPDLQTAQRVVAGGRALGSAENFALIDRLAAALGAAVGASRAAVDAAYVTNDLQVGQTGKIIAPELYLAIGISGAIQHITGIKDAGTIVAINRDAEAPIFALADLSLVADLFTAVPELTALINSRRP